MVKYAQKSTELASGASSVPYRRTVLPATASSRLHRFAPLRMGMMRYFFRTVISLVKLPSFGAIGAFGLVSDKTIWSTFTCPQPPLTLSTMRSLAFLPLYLSTSKKAGESFSSSAPEQAATAFSPMSSSMHVPLWAPPPIRKTMYLRSIVNSGEVSVPVDGSPLR